MELDQREVPPEELEEIRRLLRVLSEGDAESEIPDDLLRHLQQSLTFFHRGADGGEHEPGLGAQSQGPLTWLATVGPALEALQEGGVLLIDELDASLHSPPTLLDNTPTQLLDSGEVWLCEKDDQGCSELFSLSDFRSIRKPTNKQRRYLVGAFGGIPRVDTGPIRRVLTEG